MTKKTIKEIEKELNNLEEGLSTFANELIPNLDFSSMAKDIEKLRNYTSASIQHNIQHEGETCMHGNSWHSECTECNEMSTIDDVFELVEDTPNDAELGAKVRELYHSYTTDSDNTKE